MPLTYKKRETTLSYFIIFFIINVTEKKFCHMGNRTQDLDTNRLTLSHFDGVIFIYRHKSCHRSVANPGYPCTPFSQIKDRSVLCSTSKMKMDPEFIAIVYDFMVFLLC